MQNKISRVLRHVNIYIAKKKKKMNLDLVRTYAKINSRTTINLNVIDKAIKLLKEDMLEYFSKFPIGKDFLYWT